MITILEIKQNSEAWHVAREGKVTGSIADNLLTRGLEETLKANFSRFRGNFYTARGHILEEEAIEIYEAVHEVIVNRPGLVINDAYPDCACSPDGIDREFLLEVKALGAKKHSEIKNVKSIPFKIMAQLQFNMMITGLKTAILIMYNPDFDDPAEAYFEIIVKANPKIQQNLKLKLRAK